MSMLAKRCPHSLSTTQMCIIGGMSDGWPEKHVPSTSTMPVKRPPSSTQRSSCMCQPGHHCRSSGMFDMSCPLGRKNIAACSS
jgi:hypothetical protein